MAKKPKTAQKDYLKNYNTLDKLPTSSEMQQAPRTIWIMLQNTMSGPTEYRTK
jgi:hypothetical protein